MLVTTVLVVNEVLFWVLIGAGLVARYRLRRPRLGAGLLVAAPLVDLVLLGVSVWDLRRGSEPHLTHALAAIYIGVSVGFGHRMVAWADVRYAHRFAGGPAPEPEPAKGTLARAHAERAGWLRHLLAWAVGSALLLGAALLVGDSGRTGTFTDTARLWTIILLVDLAFGFSRDWLRPADQRGNDQRGNDQRGDDRDDGDDLDGRQCSEPASSKLAS